MTEATHALQDTAWLAEKLGLSTSTIERLRSKSPLSLPPHLSIGNSIRYDPKTVNDWIAANLSHTTVDGLEVARAS